MKKIIFAILLAVTSLPVIVEARTIQVGGDFVVPYRVSSPRDRLGSLAGGHLDVFLNNYVSAGSGIFFGVQNDDVGDKPLLITPGLTFYLPTPVLNPFIRANIPIRLTGNKDAGAQGGLGLLANLGPVGLEYSVDATYYFDAKSTIVNWVHVGVVLTF